MNLDPTQHCEVCGKPIYCMFRDRIEFVDETGKGFFSIPGDKIHYMCSECYAKHPRVTHCRYISLKQLRYVLDCSSCEETKAIHMAMEPLLKNCLEGIQVSLREGRPIGKVASGNAKTEFLKKDNLSYQTLHKNY